MAAVHAWNLATILDKLSENCSKYKAREKRCFVHVPVCRYGMLRPDSLIFHHFIKLALMVVSAYDLFFSGLYPKLSATPPNNLFSPALSSSPNRVLQVGPIEFIFSCLKRREYWISSVIWNIAYSLWRITEHLVRFHILKKSYALFTCPLLLLCGPDFNKARRWPVCVTADAEMKILNQTRRTLGIIT